jgi:putative membrane protein
MTAVVARVSRPARLWILIAIYAAARVLPVFSGNPPPLAVVALHVLPPLLFALIHGASVYGIRDILVFTAICLVAGNIAENAGVATGFPYGRYYFTGFMGPKLFYVPVLLGLAYIGMGYVSWIVAALLCGRRALLPLTAAAVMTVWDLSLEPTWSTVLHAWIWLDGGMYFGVPLTNFLGWLLTTYVIYGSFAWYLRGAKVPLRDSRAAIAFYAVSAFGNFFLLIPMHRLTTVADAAGRIWNVSAIAMACAIVSCGMLAIGAAAHWKSR